MTKKQIKQYNKLFEAEQQNIEILMSRFSNYHTSEILNIIDNTIINFDKNLFLSEIKRLKIFTLKAKNNRKETFKEIQSFIEKLFFLKTCLHIYNLEKLTDRNDNYKTTSRNAIYKIHDDIVNFLHNDLNRSKEVAILQIDELRKRSDLNNIFNIDKDIDTIIKDNRSKIISEIMNENLFHIEQILHNTKLGVEIKETILNDQLSIYPDSIELKISAMIFYYQNNQYENFSNLFRFIHNNQSPIYIHTLFALYKENHIEILDHVTKLQKYTQSSLLDLISLYCKIKISEKENNPQNNVIDLLVQLEVIQKKLPYQELKEYFVEAYSIIDKNFPSTENRFSPYLKTINNIKNNGYPITFNSLGNNATFQSYINNQKNNFIDQILECRVDQTLDRYDMNLNINNIYSQHDDYFKNAIPQELNFLYYKIIFQLNTDYYSFMKLDYDDEEINKINNISIYANIARLYMISNLENKYIKSLKYFDKALLLINNDYHNDVECEILYGLIISHANIKSDKSSIYYEKLLDICPQKKIYQYENAVFYFMNYISNSIDDYIALLEKSAEKLPNSNIINIFMIHFYETNSMTKELSTTIENAEINIINKSKYLKSLIAYHRKDYIFALELLEDIHSIEDTYGIKLNETNESVSSNKKIIQDFTKKRINLCKTQLLSIKTEEENRNIWATFITEDRIIKRERSNSI